LQRELFEELSVDRRGLERFSGPLADRRTPGDRIWLGFPFGIKHHQAYITNANNALKDYPDLAAKPVVGALDAERAHSGTFALFDYVRKRQPVGTDWRLGEPQTSKFNVAGVSCALSSHGNGVNSGPHYVRFPWSVWIPGRARQYLGRSPERPSAFDVSGRRTPRIGQQFEIVKEEKREPEISSSRKS
jgi:hypothetical protein